MTLENHFISSNESHSNAKLKLLLSNRQLALLKHLSDIDSKLADMYIGALVALKQEKNPHRIQQSAYSIRELLDNIGKKSFEYEEIDTTEYRLGVEVRNLKGEWDKRIRNTECYTDDNKWTGNIDVHLNKLLYSIEKFFDEFQRNRATRSESFPVIKKHLDPVGIPLPRILLSQYTKKWVNFLKYFNDVLHHNITVNYSDFAEKINEFENFMSDLFQPQTYEDIEEIDSILEEKNKVPKPEEIDRIIELIGKQYSNYEHFFIKLDSPDWIRPLLDKGLFKDPPIPNMNWPESKYLAKMASKAPKIVSDIITYTIPDTDNLMVHYDFVVAALELPTENKKELRDITKKEIEWIKKQGLISSLLVYKYGDLLGKLIKSNEIETAFDLADVLLEVLPDPNKDEKKSFNITPQSRFDSFHYKEIIRKNFADLTKSTGIKTIDLLCNKLIKYIELSKKSDDNEFYENYTYSWRPAIEDHAQNPQYDDLGDMLVSAVRDMSIILIEHDKTKFPEIISHFRNKNSQIFDRITFFLLTEYPDYLPVEIIALLTDEKNFERIEFIHEYARLIDVYFDKLPPEKQQIIYDWIDNPDMEMLRRIFKGNMDRDPDENEMIERKEKWQLEKLALIKKHLKGEREKENNRLEEKYGEPKYYNFAVYTSIGFVGRTSPISTEEFKEMTIDQIIESVNKWKWPGGFDEPTPEGLSRELSNIVKNEPERFASEAEKFKNLKEPTYVRGIIVGFNDALKEDKTFEWSSLLDLCQWAISQPREIEGRSENNYDIDPGWWPTWKSIARLLEDGFVSKTSFVPIEHQVQVWKILSFIAEDPSPSKEEEKGYVESISNPATNPATLSINTVRGVAMHAVVRYALWLRRDFDKQPNFDQLKSEGFNKMPEVREVLEKHLDTKHDRSYAIRSVYGQWFPWLLLLDENWAKDNVQKIFPEKEGDRLYLKAAWEAYIVFCPPFDDVFKILEKQYSDAIDVLSTEDDKEERYFDPVSRLSEHLVTFYWRGIIGLKDPLFKKFWEKADDSLRGHAIDFMGRNLSNEQRNIEKDILDRFKALWDFRLSVANSAGQKGNFKKEMASFGWWFTSNKLDDEWVLPKLHESIKISKKVEFDHDVVKKLAEVSEKYPEGTFQCFNEIARGEVEIWDIKSWQEDAYTILENAINSGDENLKQEAKDLANYLGSKGFTEEFRDLVKQSSS